MKALNNIDRGSIVLNAPALPRKLPERDMTPIWVVNKITGKKKCVPSWLETQFDSLHLEKCDAPEPEKPKKGKKESEKVTPVIPTDPAPILSPAE